jgi:hypothetical protein
MSTRHACIAGVLALLGAFTHRAAAQVVIVPSSAEVSPGGQVRFSALFHDDPTLTGTWTLYQGPGTIDYNSGIYQAPTGVPSGTMATVKACNILDITECGLATVTIYAPSIAVNPSRIEVLPGTSGRLTAVVHPNTLQPVKWTLSPSGYGKIDPNGTFTAPRNDSIPGPLLLIAKACSAVQPSLCATALIDVPKVMITISGTNPFLAKAGAQMTLGANVTGPATSQPVTWVTPRGRVDSTGFNSAVYTAPTPAVTAAETTYVRAILKNAPDIWQNFTLELVPPIAITSPGTWNAAQSNNVTIQGTGFGLSPVVALSDPGIVFTVNSVSNTSINLTAPLYVQQGARPLTITVGSTTDGVTPQSATATVTPTPATIAVTPASASLREAQTQQFASTCTAPNGSPCSGPNSVSWKASVGGITGRGLYTAPATVASVTSGTVTACWSLYPEHCKTAAVTINPLTVTVSPAALTMGACTTQQFTATVTNAASGGFTWQPTAVGTMGANGVYTAPCPLSAPTTVQVKACSTVNMQRCGTTLVTLAGTVAVTLSPPSVDFGGQRAGFATPARTVMLANSGTVAMKISSIVTNGEFTQTNGCGTPLAAGASCAVSVRFNPAATSTGKLQGTLQVYSDAPGSPATATLLGTVYSGFHDAATCTSIAGWAYDTSRPDAAVNVYVFDGASLLATLAANLFRADLAGTYGNGYHGFDWPTPASLKDGQPHSVTIRYTSDPSGTPIPGSPKTLTCASGTPSYRGYHETTTCSVVTGWGWNANAPATGITLYVFQGTQLLGSTVADKYRSDLASAGIGDGRHAFDWIFPSSLKDGQQHSISVRFGNTSSSAALTGSPQLITCSPSAPPSASIAWIHPAEEAWGPAGTLTAAGYASNGTGGVQLVWRERGSTGVWGAWTTVAYQPPPGADGTWSNSISSGNPTDKCHWFQAYVNYSGVQSATFQYTGATGCP